MPASRPFCFLPLASVSPGPGPSLCYPARSVAISGQVCTSLEPQGGLPLACVVGSLSALGVVGIFRACTSGGSRYCWIFILLPCPSPLPSVWRPVGAVTCVSAYAYVRAGGDIANGVLVPHLGFLSPPPVGCSRSPLLKCFSQCRHSLFQLVSCHLVS